MNYEQLRAEKMAALKSKDTVKNNVITMSPRRPAPGLPA